MVTTVDKSSIGLGFLSKDRGSLICRECAFADLDLAG